MASSTSPGTTCWYRAVADDVLADHPGCQKIVGIAKRVIYQMPPF